MSNRHQRWTAGTANGQEVQTMPETYEEFELFAFKIAHQWKKAVMLRLGRFQRVVGLGPFWVIPLVDRVAAWVDHRMMVTPFGKDVIVTEIPAAQ